MRRPDVTFEETAARRSVESVPLSHLSIELGHLYIEEFAGGVDQLRRHFARVVPWAAAARQAVADRTPNGRPRVSTCFMIDDYFQRFSTPRVVMEQVREAARDAGLVIDYFAREAGCAHADDIPLAELVLTQLVSDPVPETTGDRPPTSETGWLCNGRRSPTSGPGQAMSAGRAWQPPVQNAANRHSIFMDVELWDYEEDGRRRWSCPFLAAVWQLMRLGLLRHEGEGVTNPYQLDDWPDDWDEMPAVVKLNPHAAPFSAYRAFSVLGSRFLPIEHAVRTILSQVSISPAVLDQIQTRSRNEHIDLPKDLVERIEYVFTSD
ncbi:SCO2522 family protein [Micromonospora sp. WMMD1102]|uniref:SCO2522 family protein n=1 Tax=Micromonospora sp. WMMD1102 TaxID=3016105 RepID=UPI0024158760|nr:SCO2522 family protein [Micromonospora sp. WMMD1102]MDG4790620.1 SCO2522 family protein [Micromonospora sp. WMMD1102]